MGTPAFSVYYATKAENGRLILPLTAGEFPAGDVRHGAVFRIERQGSDFLAQRISGVAIFPCEGMRDAESQAAVAAAFARGRVQEVTRLYRRDDVPEENCWLRGTGWSLAFR
jgi:protein-L-isoaspartate(D-aspartate) O-methyltransferase